MHPSFESVDIKFFISLVRINYDLFFSKFHK
nr:MAG TPA: hypothetical protein [Caudoviricetes sp.]